MNLRAIIADYYLLIVDIFKFIDEDSGVSGSCGPRLLPASPGYGACPSERTPSPIQMSLEHDLSLPLAHAPYDDQTLLKIRSQYLSSLPQGGTVDGGKARDIANFFATPMGSTILNYFNNLTVQPDGTRGLNRYGLSDANYRLWMGIKILAGNDVNVYARSLAADKNLFAEFIEKSQPKK